ncbi:hypothetical protein V5O48_002446 [Marasmius crinis-equi]|uniref:Uncharacterized protein n=1 Tax=Marasmius crinis-equi TaxID=585013 RepID=A0ABR3FVL9_9AGAR
MDRPVLASTPNSFLLAQGSQGSSHPTPRNLFKQNTATPPPPSLAPSSTGSGSSAGSTIAATPRMEGTSAVIQQPPMQPRPHPFLGQQQQGPPDQAGTTTSNPTPTQSLASGSSDPVGNRNASAAKDFQAVVGEPAKSTQQEASGSSDPKGKRKASAEEDFEALVGRPASSRKRRNTGHPKKTAREMHRVLQSDLNRDEKLLLLCMFLWVRILWRLLDSDEPPILPTPEELVRFESRFSDSEAVTGASSENASPIINPKLVDIPTRTELLRVRRKNTIVSNALQVNEEFLDHARLALSKFGLMRWCVDLSNTPDSLFNEAAECVALSTFRQGILSGAFSHMSCPQNLVRQHQLHVQLYHHVVFQHFKDEWSLAQKFGAESLQMRNSNNTIYQNRLRLSTQRYKFLKKSGYPARYLVLADPRATSDDEEIPGTRTFAIKKRPERSEAAEAWYRRLDTAMSKAANFSFGGPRLRKRIVPDDQGVSITQKYPTGMPLDYFDPTYWSELPPLAKGEALTGGGSEQEDKVIAKLKGHMRIAFLEDPAKSLGAGSKEMQDMEKLSDEAFYRLRRDKVLPLYGIDIDTNVQNGDGDVDMN